MNIYLKVIDSYKLFHLYSHFPVPLKIQESLFTIVARCKYMQFYMRQRLGAPKDFFIYIFNTFFVVQERNFAIEMITPLSFIVSR